MTTDSGRQAGDQKELTIEVTEKEFCRAVAQAVTDYFEGGECSGSEFAGLQIALAAFDLLRDGRT